MQNYMQTKTSYKNEIFDLKNVLIYNFQHLLPLYFIYVVVSCRSSLLYPNF